MPAPVGAGASIVAQIGIDWHAGSVGSATGDRGNEGERLTLADRVHRYSGVPVSFIYAALTTELDAWLRLQPGEVRPAVSDAVPDQRVVWSSFWPDSPDDTIELDLARYGDGTEIRWRWHSSSPPDARGIAITRQRLNKKLGGDLRGLVSAYTWGPSEADGEHG